MMKMKMKIIRMRRMKKVFLWERPTRVASNKGVLKFQIY